MIKAALPTEDSGLRLVTQVEDLSHFQSGDCAATLLQRTLLREFQLWLDTLPTDQWPTGRIVLRADRLKDTVENLCAISALPKTENRALLINDIVHLGETFAALMGVSYLRLRLQKVTNNACSKFQIDAVSARLICTYRGTGTQYGVSYNGEEPTEISTVATGSPILLRGTLWPEATSTQLLHRSPPIAETGKTRFLLVFDPVFDPEDEH